MLADADEESQVVLLESIRNPGEVQSIKDRGGYLIATEASLEKRFEWSKKRKLSTDDVSFERFKELELAELESDDPAAQNLIKVISMADEVINNSGSEEEFMVQIDAVMNLLLTEA